MFFGVPNRGAELAGTASSILTLLSNVFNVNRNVVHDLESKSQRLANLASEFRQIRKEHNIPVICFFETVTYNNTLGLVGDDHYILWLSTVEDSVIKTFEVVRAFTNLEYHISS